MTLTAAGIKPEQVAMPNPRDWFAIGGIPPSVQPDSALKHARRKFEALLDENMLNQTSAERANACGARLEEKWAPVFATDALQTIAIDHGVCAQAAPPVTGAIQQYIVRAL